MLGKKFGFGLAAAVLVVASCGGTSSPTTAGVGATTTTSAGAATTVTPTETYISINDFKFSPATLTVTAGTTVSWRNDQGVTHTVTADDGSFDSGDVVQGAEFSQVFATAGTFAYHCTIHDTMTGTVTVEG